jgi:hypothetical protein
MKIEDINRSKIPVVRIDKSLDSLANKVLFPEKVKLANRLLKNVSLPKLTEAP